MHVKTIGSALRNLAVGFGLRGKLVRRIGGSGLVLFIAIGVLNYNQVSSSLQQQAEQTGRAQAAAAAKQLDGVLQTIAARVYQMGTVAAMPGCRPAAAARLPPRPPAADPAGTSL